MRAYGLTMDPCKARIHSNTALHLAVRTLQVPAVPVAVTSTGTKALSVLTHEGEGKDQ
jgi:hypothetical protein